MPVPEGIITTSAVWTPPAEEVVEEVVEETKEETDDKQD